MMCRSSSTPAAPVLTERAATRPDDRAGDRDRQHTADLLALATGRGLLQVDELDQRLGAVWSATSTGELASVTDDLPDELRREHAHQQAALQAKTAARAGLAGHVRSYLAVMALLVGIWLAVGLAGGSWYPWPVWPALGWGIGVAGHVRAARAPLP